MKLATILPTKYLHLIKDRPYHMALAHLIGKDKEYTDFYKDMSTKGHYVILDNGVIEGDQQDIETICNKAMLIGASEIILPDVFLDCESTISSTYNALEYVKTNYPTLKVMAVPQGRTMDEWIKCAATLTAMNIDAIGVPKVLTKLCGAHARLHAIRTIHEAIGIDLSNIEIHLLGCWACPLELTAIEKAVQQGIIPEVRGCDSAIAYAYAREDKLINISARPEGSIDFSDTKTAEDSVLQNIAIWESSVLLR